MSCLVAQTEAEQRLRDLEKELRLQIQHTEEELQLREKEAQEAKSQLQALRSDQVGSTAAHKEHVEILPQIGHDIILNLPASPRRSVLGDLAKAEQQVLSNK